MMTNTALDNSGTMAAEKTKARSIERAFRQTMLASESGVVALPRKAKLLASTSEAPSRR